MPAQAPGEPDGRLPPDTPVRQYHLLAGRLHVARRIEDYTSAPVSDSEFYESLVKVFSETKGYEQRRPGHETFIWVFGNLIETKINDNPVLFARLGKLRQGRDHNLYDWDNRVFKSTPLNIQTATGYSNFIVEPKSRLILFEVRPPTISHQQFVRYFKGLYGSHSTGFQGLDVTLLSERQPIFDFVRSLDKVTEVAAEIHPSNPEMSDEFKSLHEALIKAKADRAIIKLSNRNDGLAVEGTLASEAVALAHHGYGSASIDGFSGKEHKSISTKARLVTEEIDRAPDEPRRLVKHYWEKLNQVKKRLR